MITEHLRSTLATGETSCVAVEAYLYTQGGSTESVGSVTLHIGSMNSSTSLTARLTSSKMREFAKELVTLADYIDGELQDKLLKVRELEDAA